MPLGGSAPPHCPATDASDRFPAFSRDGTRLYFHTKRDGQAAIYVVPLVGGAPAERVLADAGIPATSPTADLLVFRTPVGGVNLLDLVTRRVRPLSTHVTPGVHTAHFSKDGARVAVTNGGTEIVEVDAKTGEIVSRFATRTTPIKNAFYLAGHVAFTATVWRGDLWAADVVDPR